MYKIGVIGDRASVLGFKALGLDVYPVNDADVAKAKLRELAAENTAIIYITEDLSIALEKEIDKYKDQKLPAIIPFPGRSGATGRGMDSVKKSVERAVGADILFGGNN